MLPELHATASAYAISARKLETLVEDFEEMDWRFRDACGHSPRWIVGHLAKYRKVVATIMGAQGLTLPFEDAFDNGTADEGLPKDLPMEPVLESFRAAHASMTDAWDHLTPALLNAPCGRTMPDGTQDFGGVIRYLAWHEAYHVGQLALLRGLAGKPKRG